MKQTSFLLMLVVLLTSAARAETHTLIDIPTAWKLMAVERLSERFPGGKLQEIGSTTDASEIISICGRMLTGGRSVPFYLMMFPGDPPTLMPIVGGTTEDIAEQVRSICSNAALPLD